ncbi:uncharacterized protein [Triticum aestivum]|uniref:uncharacterized protein n=1 Tax=Triticum aestivum TaxID=4565 RepID=UPI001D0282F2|nr:uncharacterized protein LOC123117187 [Triticum aestivum]
MAPTPAGGTTGRSAGGGEGACKEAQLPEAIRTMASTAWSCTDLGDGAADDVGEPRGRLGGGGDSTPIDCGAAHDGGSKAAGAHRHDRISALTTPAGGRRSPHATHGHGAQRRPP